VPYRPHLARGRNTADAPIEYADEFVQLTDDQAASWLVLVRQDARLPTLIGNCPNCNHECEAEVTDVVVLGGTPASAEPAPIELMTRQIICNCRYNHHQPRGRPGCGRHWLVTLVLQSDGSYALSVQKDTHLLSPAAALNRALAKQNERIQGAAEKWIGAIIAIYGLFSLTGIATAQNALSGMSTISKSLVAFVLLASLTCAGFALAAGYVAAYGWPRTETVRNDKQLQEWYAAFRGYAATAARRLQWAVVLSFCSLGTLAIVMLLVWFLPRYAGLNFPNRVT
jgi:hypothetical protein